MEIERRLMAVFVAILLPATVFSQADEVRTATITDTSGVKTDIQNLDATGSYFGPFDTRERHIAVVTDTFVVAISPTMIHTISMDGPTAKIRYVYEGEIREISGSLKPGAFKGASDFGDYELSYEKLKTLEFAEAPAPDASVRVSPSRFESNSASLQLWDGTSVEVTNLRRHDSYYSTEGYLIGGTTVYRFFSDIRMKRGEAMVTVDFVKVQEIVFDGFGAVTVTLKNGNRADGTLTTESGAGVDGFTGFYEKGYFFIDVKFVAAIRFD